MSADANRAEDIFNLVSLLCNLPLQLIVTLFVLWYYFGWALFSAFLFAAFAFKLNKHFFNRTKVLSKEKERLGDDKKNLLGEVFNNIKMLKLFGWERHFS